MDVVVEGYYGAGEVERGVGRVGEVVAEGEVGAAGWDADAVALGEVGRVELFLLGLGLAVVVGMGGMAYFEGRAGRRVERPVVIQVETYEAEDGEVEEDFPAGDEAAVAVECVAEVSGSLLFL